MPAPEPTALDGFVASGLGGPIGGDGGGADHGTAVWSTPQWRERATAWADQELAAHGIRRTGASEQPHLRPWSTVLRLPTSAGSVWLKAPGPGLSAEVGLYAVLARHAPDHVLVPYAVDVVRSWLLLPDGGAVLVTNTPESQPVWLAALRGYARLQRSLVDHVDEVLAAGVADHRPTRLAERFDEALDGCRALARDDDERADVERLAPARSLVVDLADELAASAVPATLQHDDLHRDNVFVHGARVFDWGDAVVAHPFGSLLVALRDTADPYGVGPDDARVVAARDAYLEAWGGPTPGNLRDAAVAQRVGAVSRSVNWLRALKSLPDNEIGDVREAPVRWLARLLDEPVSR